MGQAAQDILDGMTDQETGEWTDEALGCVSVRPACGMDEDEDEEFLEDEGFSEDEDFADEDEDFLDDEEEGTEEDEDFDEEDFDL